LNPKVPRLKNLGSVDQGAVEQKSSSGIVSAPFVTEFSFSIFTTMKSLTHELINALAELDSRLTGLGLYASSEHMAPGYWRVHTNWKIEWDLALRPRLEKLGCLVERQPAFEVARYYGYGQPIYTNVRFMTPTAQVCDMRLVRTSMIKVRRYGTGYHLDRTVDFANRWAQLKMEKHVRQLWWPNRYQATADIRLVLFLGFDKANRPFHPEFVQLEKSSHWPEHRIKFKSKSWPDTHGRDFNILAACWASATEKNS